MDKLPQTARTTLKRLPQRGNYDQELINQILDDGFVCHVGFAVDGQPFVIPTGYARVGARAWEIASSFMARRPVVCCARWGRELMSV
jgi:nitroimidazol reductase NimA-like FMN-containing flavoprotein (pyridoxamine 5'-phosphate oxidase superfamily)